MLTGLARDLRTIVITVVTTSVVVGVPATAAVIAANSDKVDGKHAVGSGASVTSRKGKLVATSPTSGRLPSNLIAKAPDADKLDGKDSTAFQVGSGGKTGTTTNIQACNTSVLADYPITVTTPSQVFATGFSTLYVTSPGPVPYFSFRLRDASDNLVASSSMTAMAQGAGGNPRMGMAELLFTPGGGGPYTATPGTYTLQLFGANYGSCTGYTQHQSPRLTHLLVPAG